MKMYFKRLAASTLLLLAILQQSEMRANAANTPSMGFASRKVSSPANRPLRRLETEDTRAIVDVTDVLTPTPDTTPARILPSPSPTMRRMQQRMH